MSQREKPRFDVLKKIDKERELRGWSEYTLAKNADLTQSTISTWFRKGLQPSVASLEKICAAFGITLSQFFEENAAYDAAEEQKELVHLWMSLSPTQRDIVLQLLRNI